MLGVPQHYEINKQFDNSVFITSELAKNEKKIIKDNIINVQLVYQISGEEIPSIIEEEHNCQVILLFDVKLKDIKNAKLIGEKIQRIVKPLAIIRFHDIKGLETYCFAYKRLNKFDNSQIVIEDIVLTPFTTIFIKGEIRDLIYKFLSFDSILNKSNKLFFYYEMLCKAMIINNRNQLLKYKELLSSKLFYDFDKMIILNRLIRKINNLEKEKAIAITVSDKAKFNVEIKNNLEQINNLI